MTRTYPTGYRGGTITEAALLASTTWARIDPEFARRVKALMDASADAGRRLGIGGAWRSSEGQRTLFLSRHHPEDDDNRSGSIYWRYTLPAPRYGKPAGTVVEWWERNDGAAPAAPPGSSYHESTTAEGKCLAVDMVGDLEFQRTHAKEFGLIHFAHLGELWHLQPSEIPQARRGYRRSIHEPLKPWGPVPPAPPPPAPSPVVPKPTLKLTSPAMSGKEVASLQALLREYGWMTGPMDGWFGPVTDAGVRKMQAELGVKVDGIYGPVTAAALAKRLGA